MKKLFLTAAAGMLAFSALAQDDKVEGMQVHTSGALDPVEFELGKVQKITFDNDRMIVLDANGTTEFNLADLERITFATISGVEEIYDLDLGNDLVVNIRYGELTARQDGEQLNLRIYDMNGRTIDAASATSELTYRLSDLSAGTYIVVVNDKAIKFIR